MKQCPECNEVFDNAKAYCDIDGSLLIEEKEFVRAESQSKPATGPAPGWVTGAIGGFIGVIVCILLYIGVVAPGRQDAKQDQRTNQTTSSQANQVAPYRSIPPADIPFPSPSPSPAEAVASPSVSPVPPPAAPAPAALNNGPIATGDKSAAKGERAIIKMKDGSQVEADAAWEDAQGVWYRRSGLVSFVEKSRVEAIVEPPPRRPAAATETKTP